MTFAVRILFSCILLCAPLTATAEDFDVFRFNVPYDIDLGTPDYREIVLRVMMTIEGGALGYQNNLKITPDQDGRAKGKAVFEFRRSMKTKNAGPSVEFKTQDDGALSLELLKEDYDRLIAAKRFSISYGLIWAVHKNRETHWFMEDGTARWLKNNADDSQVMMLSNASDLYETREYSFDDNQIAKPDLSLANPPETIGVVRTMTSTQLKQFQTAIAGQNLAAPGNTP